MFILDNSDSEDNVAQVPSHYFDIQTKKTKRNPDGVTTSLIIPPYVFKRKNQYKDSAVFTCNSCDKQGVSTIARAKQTGEKENGFPEYELVSWPRSHKCAPSSNFHRVREFSDRCYAEVDQNPTKPIFEIYEEVSQSMSENMNEDEKKLFFFDIPDKYAIKAGLYRRRRHHIPRAPISFVSFFITQK